MKAVVFDLDDTLHDDTRSFREAAEHVAATRFADPAVGARAAERYVVELERFWAALTSADLGESVAGMRRRLWTAAVLEAAGAVIETRDPETGETRALPAAEAGAACALAYDVFRRARFALWEGVLELLAELRAAGVKVGLLTNGLVETHREKIALLGLSSSFDAVVIADEAGAVKPQRRVFEIACEERLGVPCAEATMVGDRLDKDVAGGRGAGMATLWLNVRGETLPAGVPPPDAVAASFPEAAALLLAALRDGLAAREAHVVDATA